ncbi:uncharacterized protein N7459_003627 [Penicillium hispanicum]|uniref:uncharacterized protein n=1 Tax=Penicillium hispanicum TaxID=1080232 RepID=UPI0025402DC6|nr:uncharacterized protein N7459_003627 [Penicillium hispanicum]KAJ5587862.1 hypothetical protein N7459_003627 [Penicillium hispanicum]
METVTYKEAHWLLDVLKQFSSISGRFDITYAVAKRNDEHAQRPQRKDASFSAHELASHITIDGDHANMNKFSSAHDEGYMVIKRQIAKLIDEMNGI